jgi:mannosidase alpha-like ER degradation enhancer 2
MKRSAQLLPAVLITALVLPFTALAQAATPAPVKDSSIKDAPISDAEKVATAARVRTETLHAWNAYKKYAWGHDELKPLTHKGFDWYGHSLLMTPIDALDTLILMGLKPQADEARQLIDTQLNLDQDISVKDFEITIRLLGSLLSCYQLTGDHRLLELADDLGRRMLPMFDSPTGMPYTSTSTPAQSRASFRTPPKSARFSLNTEHWLASPASSSITTKPSAPSSSSTTAALPSASSALRST